VQPGSAGDSLGGPGVSEPLDQGPHGSSLKAISRPSKWSGT